MEWQSGRLKPNLPCYHCPGVAVLGRSRAHKDGRDERGFRVQPALGNVVQQPIEAAMGVVEK